LGFLCASGTDALLISLLAFDIKKDDYILTTPFSFIAAAEVISLIGAKPVFIDVDDETYNIDCNEIEKYLMNPKDQVTNKRIDSNMIKGIVAVDIFGLCADYEKINKIAKKNKLFVIEDAAQSFGAEYKNKKSCSLTEIGCTSFYPTKTSRLLWRWRDDFHK